MDEARQNTGQVSQRDSAERRRFVRIKFIVGLVCKRQDRDAINVFTDDVSMGGIKYFSHLPLQNNEKVRLEIPSRYGPSFYLNGRVVWVKNEDEKHTGGIEFDDPEEEVLSKWKKFVNRNSSPGQEI